MGRSFSVRETLLVAAVLAVLLGVAWGVVTWVSPKSENPPASWELTVKSLLRDHLEEAVDAAEIHNPQVSAALQTIEKRLESGLEHPLPYPVEIVVVASSEINALTFPGGLIVVNRGLLEHAANAEEVAAVLAHEMGHVFHHDPADALKRSLILASLSVLSSDSNALREVAQMLAHNAFTRTVEDRADDFAFAALARAGISPSHFGDFLAGLPDSPQGRFVQKNLPYLLDHPSRERRILKAKSAPFSGTVRPLAIDWAQVRSSLSGGSS